MANPKYADLPGIAHDQPDVYETTDLPESEQGCMSTDPVVDQCDSVETLKVSANEAYGKFKGKGVDSKDVDFTDSIGRSRKSGYDVRSGDWEMIGDRSTEEETPLQKFNRIQFELKELYEQLNEVKETSDKEKDSQMSPVTLVQQVENLQRDLQNIHMEKILGSDAVSDISDPLGSLHKKLLSELDSFKNVPIYEKKDKPSSGSTDENVLKYELYVKPDQLRLEQTAKLTSLEQRIKSLENIIGQNKKKVSLLTSNTDEKSITAAISLMSSKLNLLDPNFLDQIEGRLVLLQQNMQQVSEKKTHIEDAEKQMNIAELFELMKKVDDLSIPLPQVVERLGSLKELHEQALQFSKAITHLDTTQQQIAHSLKNNETVLKEVQMTFAKNIEMIETNVNSINARISALKK